MICGPSVVKKRIGSNLDMENLPCADHFPRVWKVKREFFRHETDGFQLLVVEVLNIMSKQTHVWGSVLG